MQSAADQLAAVLRSDGFSPAGVAGWEGNTEVESGFDSTRENKAEGAIGFQQWEGDRRTVLDRLAASMGLAETDPRAQEEMIVTELQGYPQLLQELRSTTDAGQAAADVDAIYERSSGSARGQRIADARAIYAQIQAGQPIGQGPNSGGGAADFASFGGAANLKNPFPGGAWDPLNWPNEVTNSAGQAVGSVAGGVLKVALPFLTKATFVVGGLGLVVLGLYRASEPARQDIAGQVEQAGQLIGSVVK